MQVLPRAPANVSQHLQVIFSGQVSNGYQNLPKINRLNKQTLIDGTKWLIENKKGYETIALRSMLGEDPETYLVPDIDVTEETLKNSIPAHASFTITDEERIIRHQDVISFIDSLTIRDPTLPTLLDLAYFRIRKIQNCKVKFGSKPL
jgi:hypothetical protein